MRYNPKYTEAHDELMNLEDGQIIEIPVPAQLKIQYFQKVLHKFAEYWGMRIKTVRAPGKHAVRVQLKEEEENVSSDTRSAHAPQHA